MERGNPCLQRPEGEREEARKEEGREGGRPSDTGCVRRERESAAAAAPSALSLSEPLALAGCKRQLRLPLHQRDFLSPPLLSNSKRVSQTETQIERAKEVLDSLTSLARL